MKKINRVGLLMLLCDIWMLIIRPEYTGLALTLSNGAAAIGLILGGLLLLAD